jgi:hypothetical protein
MDWVSNQVGPNVKFPLQPQLLVQSGPTVFNKTTRTERSLVATDHQISVSAVTYMNTEIFHSQVPWRTWFTLRYRPQGRWQRTPLLSSGKKQRP